ncbi:thiamine pyrophosphate-dependent dehydrogenase E1 component subunit alpha [Micromonospora sp. C51]|uniref:thiamine pyrophosphate-dependent dehydrogenase E1 component subunit alpha n=1 Tax=Micromonospora sp. C51 TaxID=2824879 RepID=UPI001B363DA8|nr:thiamine pyrophosphate-dependent dehydrogenase E1 component subunit alpha [Micromonospora sp. C51]MBQ1047587.1 thiamine pyrophosphate-dependent dehydrogenase E1 component subunit alpha [Micromonospora sp. C51]
MTMAVAPARSAEPAAPDPVAMFTSMVLIRVFEERMMELRTGGEVIGPVHPYVGQEAIAVGVCAALTQADSLVSHYRGHGHAIARGVDLDALTAELFGRAAGLCGGKAAALISDSRTNLLMSSGIVGAGVPVAAGAAMAAQVRGEPAVSVAFIGDGALGSGAVHETLTIAAVQRLPLVIVCEHNGYQAGNRTEEVYPEVSLLRLAEAHRVRAVGVDGNDVAAVATAARDAVHLTRGGEGPTFIEARTYLTRFHLQFERPSPEVRPSEEMAAWRARDPIDTARQSPPLRDRLSDADVEAIWERARERVERAVETARSSPWPAPEEAATHVWAEEP